MALGGPDAIISAEAAAVLTGSLHQLEAEAVEPVDTLYVTMDGTGVPCVPAATRDRAGKQPDGRAATREVKLACLFTQSELDDDGKPVRDPASSSYVATFAPAETFGTLAYAEARRRGVHRARHTVVLGDGAPWIWNLASLHFPDATGIVDLYHAREHLHELAKLVAPVLGGDQHDWLTDRLHDLDRGDIDQIITATRNLELPDSTTADIDQALGYFDTNRHRMRYAHFRKRGLFVGSGAVEAGCRAVVGQRLKLSGMRWNIPGATGILTLRCHHASGRWNQLWPRLHQPQHLPNAAA